ncbi:MAG TPA: 5'-nucleotidase C-terminal domain-containing protein [Gemmatimonadales bacterium]|nr:5'-nucleotidase C-terminal domain-containing protein [Gemmatimonadales bacterium]
MHPLLALIFVLQSPSAPPAVDSAHVVVVATADVHGRALAWDYVRDQPAPGGLSRIATILESLRAQYPNQVVAVDAGDEIQGNPFAAYFGRPPTGTPTRPNPIVDAFNALALDAATPGNHEFNFGLGVLRDAAADATYPFVSANILQSDSLLFPALTVVQRGGVKIGITGLTTPGVMVWDRRVVKAGGVRVRPIATAGPPALAQLDQANVDVRIVLVHSGMGEPSTYDTTGVGAENDAAALAADPHRPDLVVVGHTHKEMRDSVIAGVHFVQPKFWAQSISVVHIWLTRAAGDSAKQVAPGRWHIVQIRADLIPTGTTPELPRFTKRLAVAQELVRAWAAQPLGTAGPGFAARNGRAEDTPLLDFINAVQRRHAGTDLSATPDFDLDAGLPDGDVHLRDVAGIYPYENTLVGLKISGQQLRDYLEHSATYYRTYRPGTSVVRDDVPGYNFDVVSGANYQIDLTRAPGSRIVGLAVRGRPVAPGDSFTIALNNYRAAGGGGYAMLRGARVVYDQNENVRDLLIEEIRRVGTVTAADYSTSSWEILPPGREAALAAFAPARPASTVRADTTLLRVLSINDLHGALLSRTWGWSQGRAVGGAAVLKTWLDSLAADCGCASVRLDAGDEMQGTPISNFTFGRTSVAALNALGIDAAAVGNHEFDWSVDTLRARMGEARYQFVAANLTDSAGAIPAWVEPWTVISRNRTKIGVIGIASPSTPTTTDPRNVRGLVFGDPAVAVRRVLPQVRATADFVIVLAHAGAVCDSLDCHGEVVDLARGLDSGSVDLIVGGDTHRIVHTVIHGIPVVEAGSSGSGIGVADLVRTGTGREVHTRVETPYADQVTPNAAVAASVERARRMVDSLTSRIVATLQLGLARNGDEYGLGRLIADAYRNMGKADVGLINNGGIRADLPGGPVSYGALFEVSPFQNRLVRLTISGGDLRRVLEHALAGGTPAAHVGGIAVWYDPRKPAGARITKLRLLNGTSVEDNHAYTLAVPDFLADGGSGYDMLKGRPRVDVGLVDLDAVIAYLSVIRSPAVAPGDVRFHPAEGGR